MNEPKFGKVEMNREILEEEDYLSFKNSDTGGTFFISNFGGDGYKCYGTCFCNDEKETMKRRSSAVLSKGLIILLSAFSLTMAMKMAKDAFQNNCAKHFSEKCDDVETVVEKCEESKIIDDDNIFKFFCEGNCIKNPDFDSTGAIKKGIDKEIIERFDCESFVLSKTIIVDETNAKKEFRFFRQIIDFVLGRQGKLNAREDEAKKQMRYQHLKPYCKSLKIENPDNIEFDQNICISESEMVRVDESGITCHVM